MKPAQALRLEARSHQEKIPFGAILLKIALIGFAKFFSEALLSSDKITDDGCKCSSKFF